MAFPQLELFVDTDTFTLGDLVDRVLKQRLGINEPTVGLGSTTLYEEGDGADDRLEVNLTKLLKVAYCCCSFGCRWRLRRFSPGRVLVVGDGSCAGDGEVLLVAAGVDVVRVLAAATMLELRLWLWS